MRDLEQLARIPQPEADVVDEGLGRLLHDRLRPFSLIAGPGVARLANA